MKTVMRSLFATAMLGLVAAPAYADSKAVHIWHCTLDGTSEAQVEALAVDWLKGVRQLEGGKDATLHLFYPVAVTAQGHSDVLVVLSVPTFSDWGMFWDAYEEGTAAAIAEDKAIDKMKCADSSLWETHDIGG